MTKTTFIILCGKYLIEPGIALEDGALCDLLKEKSPDTEIEKYLAENF